MADLQAPRGARRTSIAGKYFYFTKITLMSLLMLCGDIHPNPGPRSLKYPCGICSKAVTNSCKAIQCDHCDIWIHNKCSGITNSRYEHHQIDSKLTFICPNCEMPTFLQLIDSHILCSSNQFEYLPDETTENSIPSIHSPSSFRPPPFAMSSPDPSRTRNPKEAKRGFKIISINCNSLIGLGKRAELQAIIDEYQPHVILGQESKLGAEHANSEIFPSNYTVRRKDRSIGGGGVFILIREDIDCNTEAFEQFHTDTEIVWAQVKMPGTKLLNLASVYRPPGTPVSYMAKLKDHLNKVYNSNKNATFIIGGDMNLTQIDWKNGGTLGNQPGTNDTNLCNIFIEAMDDLGLSQHCHSITRPASDKILDLILTNRPSSCSSVETFPGMSDHNLVLSTFKLTHQRLKLPQRTIFKFDKANWEAIREKSRELTANYFLRHPDNINLEDNCKYIEDGIKEIIKEQVPSKKSKSKQSYPWITPEVKDVLRKRDRAYVAATRTRSPQQWNKFKELRQTAKNAIRKSHQNYIANLIDTDLQENQKPFWSYIKSLRQDKTSIPTLKVKNRAPASTDFNKANALVDQFSSVFTKEDLSNIPHLEQEYPDMKPIIFGLEGIQKLLLSLKPHKAGGPDELPARFLKENAMEIAPMYQHLFSQSYNSGTTPKTWCEATVCPIYKKGQKYLPENYRPVSLTAIPCKLLEHIIVSKTWEHLNQHNIITNIQHGFRSGLSCTSQLVGAVDDWTSELNTGQSQIDVIVLDFSKAFDKVPHQRLLQKIRSYGITNNNAKWIESFLTNRSHKVVINGTSSDVREVSSGVPQGTVLGPLLFLLYINDIEKGLTSKMRLFADDSAIYRRIDSEEDAHLLQQDLFRLQEWTSKWQMSFNINKCKTLRITRKEKNKTNFTYLMSDPQSTSGSIAASDRIHNQATNILTTQAPNGKYTALETITSDKYLGVTLDHHLSFNEHIDNITKKATSVLNLCRRNLHMCPRGTKELAYKALVRPLLEYASPAWNPHTSRNIEKIEQVQRRAARFSLGFYKYGSNVGLSEKIQNDLKWPSLQHRRAQADLTMFYKIKKHHILMPFPVSVQTSPIHPHKYLHIQGLHSLAYVNSFYPRTIRLWNQLPPLIMQAPSPEAFSSNVAKWIINKTWHKNHNIWILG